MPNLTAVTTYLDRTLRLTDFAEADAAHNGLQVANTGHVRRIAAGVDASLEFFEEAARRGADLLVCHHGLSWGDSLKRITGLNYRRLKLLLAHDMALYACHLPLDAHPRLGNNARLARALGVQSLEPFGRYHGKDIGFRGLLPRATSLATFQAKVSRVLGREPTVMEFGPARRIRKVAVVTGAAGDIVDEAGTQAIDAFVSGEPSLQAFHLAREHGVHAFFGGHYATETFGVRALATELGRRFRVPAEFIALDVPF